MATEIEISCTDQTLSFTQSPVIASGGENEDEITFTFCSKWDDFDKKAVFYRTKANVYYANIIDNACIIPREVLTESGVIYIGVIGTRGNELRTSKVIAYKIEQGAITTGLIPSQNQEKTVEPTGEEQIVTPDDGYAGLSKVTVSAAALQEKEIELLTTAQTVVADDGYYGLSSVIVPAMPTINGATFKSGKLYSVTTLNTVTITHDLGRIPQQIWIYSMGGNLAINTFCSAVIRQKQNIYNNGTFVSSVISEMYGASNNGVPCVGVATGGTWITALTATQMTITPPQEFPLMSGLNYIWVVT